MIASKNIFGCFVSIPRSLRRSTPDDGPANDEGEIFRAYIWGENGICSRLKQLKPDDYGKDLDLILLQFYVNPIPYLRSNLKEVERYRRDEKAIGLPIIVTDENFFNRTREQRHAFLEQSIIQKVDLLRGVIKRNKLDTNLNALRTDLEAIFRE